MKLVVLVAVFFAVVALADADKHEANKKPGEIVPSKNQGVDKFQHNESDKTVNKPAAKFVAVTRRKPTRRKPKTRFPTRAFGPKGTKRRGTGRTKGSKKPRPTKVKGPGRTKGSKKPRSTKRRNVEKH